MARLLRMVDRRLPLPLGRIEARRSHLFVGNLVDLLACCVTHPRASRRVFVVDDGAPIETRQLIRQLAGLAGKRALLLPVPPAMLRALGRVGDGVQRLAGRPVGISSQLVDKLMGSLILDSRAVRATLSWTPPFSQREGLRRTLQPEAAAAGLN
jgi:nucleoside-diphosphate-sugar epimerase